MPKKISIYTAFGQFFEFVEDLENREMTTTQSTDRYLVGLFAPSDRVLTSPIDIKHLQLQTCPTVLNDEADYSLVSMRKVQSCPTFEWRVPSIESQYLNDMTPAMMAFFDLASNKTSIESEKLNEATEHMMSFWTVNVTLRKRNEDAPPPPRSPSLFEKLDGYFEEDERIASFFEKIDGLFADDSAATQKTTIPSLFEKLSKLFAENPQIYTAEYVPSIFEKVGRLFSESTDCTAPTTSASIVEPLVHCENCMCFSCWKTTTKFGWRSNDAQDVPQLPVFVKSPIDSLRLYKSRPSAAKSPSACSCDADVEDNTETVTSPVYGPEPRKVEFVEESEMSNAALLDKIKVQREIIEKLIKLNELTEQIANLHKP